MQQALNIYAGESALKHIRTHGLRPSDNKIVLGASSGPKWLVLQAIDQYLLSQFFKPSDDQSAGHIVNTLGTSAGAWRMMSYAHPENIDAHQALTESYIHQRYSKKPQPDEILRGCKGVLNDMFGNAEKAQFLNHATFRPNLIASQCRGLSGMENRHINMLGFGLAALANKVSRKSLGIQFTRILMRHPSGGLLGQPLNDLPTRYVELRPENIKDALLASGSIPMIIEGIRNLAGKGLFQDGGITDYAFDLPLFPKDGFVLFPHFAKYPIPGWFDKAWISKRRPWRRPSHHNYDKTIMLCPSDDFIKSLPFSKIPDRHDFLKMDDYTRIKAWKEVVDRTRYLADDLDTMDWKTRAKPLPW